MYFLPVSVYYPLTSTCTVHNVGQMYGGQVVFITCCYNLSYLIHLPCLSRMCVRCPLAWGGGGWVVVIEPVLPHTLFLSSTHTFYDQNTNVKYSPYCLKRTCNDKFMHTLHSCSHSSVSFIIATLFCPHPIKNKLLNAVYGIWLLLFVDNARSMSVYSTEFSYGYLSSAVCYGKTTLAKIFLGCL